MRSVVLRSRIPIPVHVDTSKPETEIPPNLIETSMSAVVVLNHFPVSSVAERSVC